MSGAHAQKDVNNGSNELDPSIKDNRNQQIHVNKVLFCCCFLLLFETWGSLLNQSYSKENKLGSVTILMKLLVTIGDQSELKIGFPAAPGSQ